MFFHSPPPEVLSCPPNSFPRVKKDPPPVHTHHRGRLRLLDQETGQASIHCSASTHAPVVDDSSGSLFKEPVSAIVPVSECLQVASQYQAPVVSQAGTFDVARAPPPRPVRPPPLPPCVADVAADSALSDRVAIDILHSCSVSASGGSGLIGGRGNVPHSSFTDWNDDDSVGRSSVVDPFLPPPRPHLPPPTSVSPPPLPPLPVSPRLHSPSPVSPSPPPLPLAPQAELYLNPSPTHRAMKGVTGTVQFAGMANPPSPTPTASSTPSPRHSWGASWKKKLFGLGRDEPDRGVEAVSVRKEDRQNLLEEISAVGHTILKRTDRPRSPGGTPVRLPVNEDQAFLGLGGGNTDMIQRALMTKFRSLHSTPLGQQPHLLHHDCSGSLDFSSAWSDLNASVIFEDPGISADITTTCTSSSLSGLASNNQSKSSARGASGAGARNLRSGHNVSTGV